MEEEINSSNFSSIGIAPANPNSRRFFFGFLSAKLVSTSDGSWKSATTFLSTAKTRPFTAHPLNSIRLQVRVPVLSVKTCVTCPNSSWRFFA